VTAPEPVRGSTRTTAPLAKFVPVKVTDTDVPSFPLLGLTEVRVGVKSVTLRDRVLLPVAPAESVTVRLMSKIPTAVGVPLMMQQPGWTVGPGNPVAVNFTYVPVPPVAEMLAKYG
jgi:hypothetical protein